MENVIKAKLSGKRYEHSISVAQLARKMARDLGADCEKAYLAGIVHDIAKEVPPDELLKYCDEYGIPVGPVERKNIALLHAPVGAAMIKDYGIDDEEIQNAVRYHTVGRADMTLLEKIIYFADMTEPLRNYKEAEELRALGCRNFDKAFEKAVQYSLIWNLEKERLVHEGTLQAWNSILLERSNK